MQSYSLTVDKFLDHAAAWSDNGIVQALPGGARQRVSYANVRARANRLSGALVALGLEPGERIATLGWNTGHHFEIYFATMGLGLVCHTLNPRLTVAQLAAMLCEAEDVALAVASDLVPLALELVPLCPALRHVIVMDEPAALAPAPSGVRVWDYEQLLAAKGAPVEWGDFDEETPAGLCYTSGTTGEPKGVLYTHRSNYLHTLRSLQADAIGITARDVVLLAVPMFHANGWGMPFCLPAAGASVVLPGRRLDEKLARLMREEGVTVAVGVPTVWISVLDWLDRDGSDLPSLDRLLVGGSTCPETFVRRVEDRLGASVQMSWGMTELSPLGTIAPPGVPSGKTGRSGRPPLGLEIKLTDGDGVALPDQRGRVGQLWVRGASVIDRYFNSDEEVLDSEGFYTGDLAMIEEDGDLIICGRSKDLIKSGGEWINPAEIEAIVGGHPGVGAVAVIGRSDPKWGERPVLLVQPRMGHRIDPADLLGILRGRVADWWLPAEVVTLDEMPLAATGKIDKNRLRDDFESGAIRAQTVER